MADRPVTDDISIIREALIRLTQAGTSDAMDEMRGRAERAEQERDDYRAATEAVRVCSIHTRDIIDGNDCLICSLEDASGRAEAAEARNRELTEALAVLTTDPETRPA